MELQHRRIRDMERFELLMDRIDKFNKERGWDQFHTPSNLAKYISIEANELLECFQWNDTEYNRDDVIEELADVMNYCIQMSQVSSGSVIINAYTHVNFDDAKAEIARLKAM